MTESTWKPFLSSLNFSITDINQPVNALYSIDYLGILIVSGNDARSFLQGQLTTDVEHLIPNLACFTAFCNAKGKVISTLLIIKRDQQFLLILPKILLETVHKRLSRYILRAKVKLVIDTSLIMSGIQMINPISNSVSLPNNDFEINQSMLKLPQQRYLFIDSIENSIQIWQSYLNHGFIVANSQNWELLDIYSKIAWLNLQSSELYIPQMLNIDQFGGISFTKGCYIGQEIVARTHYLGTVKRQLFMIEVNHENVDSENIIDAQQQIIGQLLPLINANVQPFRLAILPVSIMSEK
ncbi:MAG: hypothetical protein RL637_753 [Pseudomonadota bacterium]|jgi:folate-binding protein YgfZ